MTTSSTSRQTEAPRQLAVATFVSPTSTHESGQERRWT
jgi:hypothetical protein